MFVLGAGLGMVMQVLVLAVQNAVEYRDLGVGTSGATFFRTIGSCVGVAVFGTIFNANLTSNLAAAPPAGAVGPCSGPALSATSQALASCPPDVQNWFLDGYSDAIHTIFLYAVPVGALAFVLAWLIPEVTLRTAASRPEQGEVFALPASRTSFEELRLLLWREVGHQDPLRAYSILTRDLDIGLTPGPVLDARPRHRRGLPHDRRDDREVRRRARPRRRRRRGAARPGPGHHRRRDRPPDRRRPRGRATRSGSTNASSSAASSTSGAAATSPPSTSSSSS